MRAWVGAGRDPGAEASRQVCLRFQTQVLSVAWYREAISVLPHTDDVLVMDLTQCCFTWNAAPAGR